MGRQKEDRMSENDWMDEDAAAVWLGVPVDDVREAIARGELPALVVGRHVRMHRQALIDLAQRPLGSAARLTAGVSGPAGDGHLPLPGGAAWLDELEPAATFEYQ